MSDEAALPGRLTTNTISRIHSTGDLGEYGGQRAMRCPDCGHVSPTAEQLREHVAEACCGLWRRWAA